MRILILGSGGMLGHMVTYYLLEQGYNVTDVSRSRKCRRETKTYDILSPAFENFMLENKFDVVINCSGIIHGAVNANKGLAIRVNSYFPHRLVELLKETNTRIIHISSGGVYHGGTGEYYENDEQSPVSFYGKTKSLGEIEGERILVIRSDVYGPDMSINGTGFFNWAMNSKGSATGYANAYFNGVSNLEYARFIQMAIENQIVGSYNLGSADSISKYHLFKLIKESFHIDVTIQKELMPQSKTVLLTQREDIGFKSKTYEVQLEELKDWIVKHKDLYKYFC